MIRKIDCLHTPTSLPGERNVPYHFHLCARWDLANFNGMQMFSQKGICLVAIFINVYRSRICVICTISTV